MVHYRYTVHYTFPGLDPDVWGMTLTWEQEGRIETLTELLTEATDRVDRECKFPYAVCPVFRVDEYTITLTRSITP